MDNFIDLFRHETNLRSVGAGQPVFLAGDEGQVMFVLVEGQADVLVGDDPVECAGPGAILGEMALIDSAPRSATVIARTACRLLPIDVEKFNALIQKKPDFARLVMKAMAGRIRSMNNRNRVLIQHFLTF